MAVQFPPPAAPAATEKSSPSTAEVPAGSAPPVLEPLPARPLAWVPKLAQPAPAAVPSSSPSPQQLKLDEAFEQASLVCSQGVRKPGRLVNIAEGEPGKPLSITVHGISGTPEDLRPYIDRAVVGDQPTSVYAYDDQFRRVTDSAKELATQLGRWIDAHPGQPVELFAHSMGGMVALRALDELHKKHKLDGTPVSLRMMSTPLGGFPAANFALMAPNFIARRIGGTLPGKDMGTWSGFQKRLAKMPLPETVKVEIFTGGKDGMFDASKERFQRIVRNVRAEHTVLPEADHMTTIGQSLERSEPTVAAR
jgi:hypothetical protein